MKLITTLYLTFFSLLPALTFAEVESKPIKESGSHLIKLVLGADPVVKLVMIGLVAMSIMCWAIIVFKFREIKQAQRDSERFSEMFWRSEALEDLVVKSSVPANPLQSIFRKGISDLLRQKKSKKQDAFKSDLTLDRLRQQVDRASDDEVAKVEKYVPFLASTGSSAPYIGLFGTVWGILAAFWEIGKAGTSSLAVVGPYIAEALIATAMGLAAAIPAVLFYNYFITRIRTLSRDIDTFAEDLLDRIQQEYFT